MDTTASATKPQKKYRLLVLDGGGMRGIGTLHILRELKRIGLDITDFDMIGGTSAGGLIALATLCGLDLDGIEDLFVAIGKATFTSSWQNTAWHRLQMLESLIRNTTAPGQHSTTDYQETLSAALADRGIDPNSTLRALGEKHRQPRVFAVASDISFISTVNAFIMRSYNHLEEESGKTKYFEVYQGTSDISLLTAAISTSAAPTYFDEHVPWKDTFLIDGGIGFNNPIFLAINELKRTFGWDAEVELVVSIGTGLPPKKVSARGKSVLDWSTTVVNLATEGDFIHKNFLLVRPTLAGFGDSIYARFNPPELGGRAMDDPSPKALRKIKKLAEDHMNERIVQSKMREIKELLRQQARPPSSSSSSSSS